jgi:pimeloyl-ACP methyl ester carboxylesterase
MPDYIRSTDLLLLPGMLCDQAMWRHQSQSLGTLLSVQTGDIGAANSIKQIAQQVLAQAPATFALAGLSMGGIVAMEMWRQAPQRIERLALLDTNYRADLPDRRRVRDRQISQVKEGHLRTILLDELKPNYLASCHRANTDLLDSLLAMGERLGETVFINQSLALRDRQDSTATLATISCPTLVLCGVEDGLCSPTLHSEMAALIPGATSLVIADCGHISTMEQPDQVTAALRVWLQDN